MIGYTATARRSRGSNLDSLGTVKVNGWDASIRDYVCYSRLQQMGLQATTRNIDFHIVDITSGNGTV
jgi:hypothetical protein